MNKKWRLIDLSMPVHQGMIVYPSVAKPVIVELESHAQMAQSMGTDKLGVHQLPNHCMIVTGDHVGTHMDSWGHVNPVKPTAEAIPIEYCFGHGVVLDLTHKKPGDGIMPEDLAQALDRIRYAIQPMDIVLIRTDSSLKNRERSYLTDHPGMTREGVLWLLDRGIKVMGIDAVGFDPPVWAMFEKKKFWEAHKVMLEREYYHLENLCNLNQIPVPFGFTVSVLPVKWCGASAAPVRAVAVFEE